MQGFLKRMSDLAAQHSGCDVTVNRESITMDTVIGFASRSGKGFRARVAARLARRCGRFVALCLVGAIDCTAALADADAAAVAVASIGSVQGPGMSSAMQGRQVVVEGIVTGDFQSNDLPDHGDLQGFFMEAPAPDRVDHPGHSQGLFIYDRQGRVDVQPGDRVRVRGTVAEYSGMTQVSAVQVAVISQGESLPPPYTLRLPLGPDTRLEALEGMRVQLPQTLVIAGVANYDRYGDVWLALPPAAGLRPFMPTQLLPPGSVEQVERSALNQRSRLLLDDGSHRQNPNPPRHPAGGVFTLENRFRAGDTLSGVTGILTEAFGHYRIQPTGNARHVRENPRPTPPELPGELRVAAFNVFNYFTTLGDAGRACGPRGGQECRGAADSSEWARQRAKLLAALEGLGADILGLVELENNAAALDDLVSGLNRRAGNEHWAAVRSGNLGDDAIRVGLAYRRDRVRTVGQHAVLDNRTDPDFRDRYNRPVLAQTFATSRGARFTVAVLHLKSKGSDCRAIDDPDRQDGQANCNATRSAAARSLVRWLADDPTDSDDPDVLILGDLNAYARETPLQVLAAAGYDNLLASRVGPSAYTYVYEGQAGTLDYVLASPSLAPQVRGAAVWHINADEPDLLDYRLRYKRGSLAELYTDDAYRSSDHDPVVVGLSLE